MHLEKAVAVGDPVKICSVQRRADTAPTQPRQLGVKDKLTPVATCTLLILALHPLGEVSVAIPYACRYARGIFFELLNEACIHIRFSFLFLTFDCIIA